MKLKALKLPCPDINIEFVEMEGKFGPELIEALSKKWRIPKNFMFIGSPGDKFPSSFRIRWRKTDIVNM